MTDIHTQIRDNVERIKKGCGKTHHSIIRCGEGKDIYYDYCESCETKLKTTIAENIKCADAMVEELGDSLCRRRGEFKLMEGIKVTTNRGRYAFLLNEKDREIFELNHKIKKWQETKQWLKARQ